MSNLEDFVKDCRENIREYNEKKYRCESIINNLIIECNKEIKENPFNKFAWFYLGTARKEKKDYVGAIFAFNRLLEIDFDQRDAWQQIRLCRIELDKKHTGISDAYFIIEKTIAIINNDPYNVAAWEERGKALKTIKWDEEAEECFSRASEIIFKKEKNKI